MPPVIIRELTRNPTLRERARKHDVILQLLFDEAEAGRLYTALQFAEGFENQAGLGGKDTIRERISVLATKSFIKFVRDGAPFGLPTSRSKFGYLCVEGMTFPTGEETADPDTGEIVPVRIPVLPSTYKCPQSGAVLRSRSCGGESHTQGAVLPVLDREVVRWRRFT
ncbi:hypothetical protein [Chelativorans sp. Marseille-P2723]|uniref:hypothetical protein n=1 Tax=Chelativorans sp. Marseille-P2723 TaxID=2709133 RepID=UPI0015715C48|nr:hypothetical protein [Chelativorans sp. Marseille-P2723]